MMAAVTGIILGQMEQSGAIGSAWRMMFVVGALPALLTILIFKRLKEPGAVAASAPRQGAYGLDDRSVQLTLGGEKTPSSA